MRRISVYTFLEWDQLLAKKNSLKELNASLLLWEEIVLIGGGGTLKLYPWLKDDGSIQYKTLQPSSTTDVNYAID